MATFSHVVWISIALWHTVSSRCPGGFTAGPNAESCYALMRASASWAEAQHYCQAFGADLAVIDSQQEQQFVNGMLRPLHDSIPTQHVWLGGTDLLQEGKFLNPGSLSLLTYFNWAPGEPDDLNGQHCIGMFKDNSFMWDDQDCEVPNYSLCEREPLSDGQIVG
ncbi:hypothetical protein ACJMK2_036637 [Sinanodonta woodiana]|uniref:C-type lectin domain-containing protein n=1 Tax=Sinanodonta woodiana TaxID=1069815 RepID=A0ABD3WI83_SINWO